MVLIVAFRHWGPHNGWIGYLGCVLEFSDSTSDSQSDEGQCRDTNISLIFWHDTETGQKKDFYRCVDLICIGHKKVNHKGLKKWRGCNTGNDSKCHGVVCPLAVIFGWNTWLLPIGQILGSDGKLQRPCGISGIWWHSMHGGATILTTMQIALLHCATLATVAAAATERVLANSRSWIFNGT